MDSVGILLGILEGFLAAAHFPIWSASKSLPVIDGCASYTRPHLAFLFFLFFIFFSLSLFFPDFFCAVPSLSVCGSICVSVPISSDCC